MTTDNTDCGTSKCGTDYDSIYIYICMYTYEYYSYPTTDF